MEADPLQFRDLDVYVWIKRKFFTGLHRTLKERCSTPGFKFWTILDHIFLVTAGLAWRPHADEIGLCLNQANSAHFFAPLVHRALHRLQWCTTLRTSHRNIFLWTCLCFIATFCLGPDFRSADHAALHRGVGFQVDSGCAGLVRGLFWSVFEGASPPPWAPSLQGHIGESLDIWPDLPTGSEEPTACCSFFAEKMWESLRRRHHLSSGFLTLGVRSWRCQANQKAGKGLRILQGSNLLKRFLLGKWEKRRRLLRSAMSRSLSSRQSSSKLPAASSY